MSKDDKKNLLMPSGIIDLINERAYKEFYLTQVLMSNFMKNGYKITTPPLIEFEENFKFAMKEVNLDNIFRLSDPVSNKLLYIRNDITPQIARIASTKLKASPRPLRLSYTGDVLRSQGNQLHPERQFRQAGIELYGAQHENAAIEVINIGIQTLQKANVGSLILDLTTPSLSNIILNDSKLDIESIKLAKSYLKIKDYKGLRNIPVCGKTLSIITESAGEEKRAIKILSKIDLPVKANKLIKKLIKICAGIRKTNNDIQITIDPVENRGFGYYSGIGFAIFSSSIKRELGFGGQYFINTNGKQENGMGLSILFDGLLRASKLTRDNILKI